MMIRANSYDCQFQWFLTSNVIFVHLCTHMGCTRGFWATWCPDLVSPSGYFLNFILCVCCVAKGWKFSGLASRIPLSFLILFVSVIFCLWICFSLLPPSCQKSLLTLSFLHCSESALYRHPFSTYALISSLLHSGFAVAVCSLGNAVNCRSMSLVLQHLSDEFTLSLRMT